MPFVIPVFIPHRGCPHDCLFCNQQKISGVSRELLQTGEVSKTIELWLTRKRGPAAVQVAFFGGSFTCMDLDQQEALLEEVQPYIRRGEVDSIRCSTRPDCIDQELCAFLVKHHVRTVELGVQSLSDTVLKKTRRGHTAIQCRIASQLLKTAGFQLGIQLMPGLPAETTASFLKTIRGVIEIRPDFVRIYPALVVKESGLEELYRDGQFEPLSMNKAVAVSAVSYQMLTDAGVGVVRMGLQPSESLEESVVAGPYHPAFGELVRSRLWFREIRQQLSRLAPGKKLQIRLSHRDISAVVGLKKQNTKRLEALGFSGRYKIVVDKTMDRGFAQYVVC